MAATCSRCSVILHSFPDADDAEVDPERCRYRTLTVGTVHLGTVRPPLSSGGRRLSFHSTPAPSIVWSSTRVELGSASFDTGARMDRSSHRFTLAMIAVLAIPPRPAGAEPGAARLVGPFTRDDYPQAVI